MEDKTAHTKEKKLKRKHVLGDGWILRRGERRRALPERGRQKKRGFEEWERWNGESKRIEKPLGCSGSEDGELKRRGRREEGRREKTGKMEGERGKKARQLERG